MKTLIFYLLFGVTSAIPLKNIPHYDLALSVDNLHSIYKYCDPSVINNNCENARLKFEEFELKYNGKRLLVSGRFNYVYGPNMPDYIMLTTFENDWTYVIAQVRFKDMMKTQKYGINKRIVLVCTNIGLTSQSQPLLNNCSIVE